MTVLDRITSLLATESRIIASLDGKDTQATLQAMRLLKDSRDAREAIYRTDEWKSFDFLTK